MEIIPAIDIINGKCVRLQQGDYSACTVYADEPLAVARQFESVGVKRLHLVDLDGAKSSTVININVLKELCKHTSLAIDFSGGIKSDADIQRVFDAGAAFAGIGSVAQQNRALTEKWLTTYGGNKIIIGADTRNGMIAINGWKTITDTSIDELIGWYADNLKYLMCTDIAKDGMLQGASVELYAELCKKYPQLNIIASGGIGAITDVEHVATTGVHGVIIGKAIYEGKISFNELKKWI